MSVMKALTDSRLETDRNEEGLSTTMRAHSKFDSELVAVRNRGASVVFSSALQIVLAWATVVEGARVNNRNKPVLSPIFIFGLYVVRNVLKERV